MKLQLKEERIGNNIHRYTENENGQKHGSYMVWRDDRSTLISSLTYIDGYKTGEAVTFNKGHISEVIVYEDDEMIRQITYARGAWGGRLERIHEKNFQDKSEVVRKFNQDNLTDEIMISYDDDGVKHQVENGFFTQSGNKRYRHQFVNGSRHGTDILYFDSGDIQHEYQYNHGKRQGACIDYHWNKQLMKIVVYDNDNITGDYISYHDNGNTNEKGAYINGEKTGEWKAYNLNGTLRIVEQYTDGYLHGLYQHFYQNSQPVEETNYVKGKKHGIRRVFNYNGGPAEVECYIENRLYGEQKIFAQTDSTRLRAHYMYLEDGEKVLARQFMKDLGIPYKNLANPSEEEKVMITLALGGGTLFCDESK